VQALRQDHDDLHDAHLREAARVLALPLDVNRLRWHPFGVYAVPLGPRTDAHGTWSRRLHVWHPLARPVGEASPYGVHTHSGRARSHVLVGALRHHLYEFAPDADGAWRRARLTRPAGRARLVAHASATTGAGTTHTLPPDQPHGVTRPAAAGARCAWAVSLFEQIEDGGGRPFTTWQRTDAPAEPIHASGPADPADVLRASRVEVEQVLASL
jgi:hypothetical protein